jgi:hypothetical protein
MLLLCLLLNFMFNLLRSRQHARRMVGLRVLFLALTLLLLSLTIAGVLYISRLLCYVVLSTGRLALALPVPPIARAGAALLLPWPPIARAGAAIWPPVARAGSAPAAHRSRCRCPCRLAPGVTGRHNGPVAGGTMASRSDKEYTRGKQAVVFDCVLWDQIVSVATCSVAWQPPS